MWHECSQHYFSESTIPSTKVKMSGQTVTAIQVSGQVVAGSSSLPQATLSPEEIPGADLFEPFKQYTVSASCWCISRALDFNLS